MLQWIWGCRYLFKIVISFPSNIHIEVGLLDHMVALFLIFWGPSVLFSTVAASIYIPNNSAQGFPFVHILANTCHPCLFDDSHSNRCEVVSHCGQWTFFEMNLSPFPICWSHDGKTCNRIRHTRESVLIPFFLKLTSVFQESMLTLDTRLFLWESNLKWKTKNYI